jgi:pimeloyl-ACP methyl ester carboxylesterase
MTDETKGVSSLGDRPPLQRDSQQWLLDYMIKTTGRVQHFQPEGHGDLPKSVHSHDMISKHVGKKAANFERLATNEESLGHNETAMDFYFLAANAYASAQHTVLALDDEKAFLNVGLRRSYDRVAALAPYQLEHVVVPWNGQNVYGYLHLNPHVVGPAPLIFHIPGCDVTKESWPHPHFNQAHQRGAHVFSFDGPGQGESLNNDVWLTADNYEKAAMAVIDVLCERPEVDENQITVYATSFGSLWGVRLAMLDKRLKALVGVQASICEKIILTDLESPRWKQLFGFITNAASEAELDQTMKAMSVTGRMSEITCPTLLTVGEYDPRSPLPETYELFKEITAPAALWVMADQHHSFTVGPGESWARGSHGVCTDWLRDRLNGVPLAASGEAIYVDSPLGPNDPKAVHKLKWFE